MSLERQVSRLSENPNILLQLLPQCRLSDRPKKTPIGFIVKKKTHTLVCHSECSEDVPVARAWWFSVRSARGESRENTFPTVMKFVDNIIGLNNFDLNKPFRFDEKNFKCWKTKMEFFLTVKKVAHVLKNDVPVLPEQAEKEERDKIDGVIDSLLAHFGQYHETS
ncbi:hypothetical protein Lal_00022715 [Lupinus albus]|nr:hypothetical protein Lal_00022715 [Lupinus albus]